MIAPQPFLDNEIRLRRMLLSELFGLGDRPQETFNLGLVASDPICPAHGIPVGRLTALDIPDRNIAGYFARGLNQDTDAR